MEEDDYGPWERWCLDEAINLWGNYVDSEVAKAGEEGKKSHKQKVAAKQMRLRMLLQMGGQDETREPMTDQFADPAAKFKKKG